MCFVHAWKRASSLRGWCILYFQQISLFQDLCHTLQYLAASNPTILPVLMCAREPYTLLRLTRLQQLFVSCCSMRWCNPWGWRCILKLTVGHQFPLPSLSHCIQWGHLHSRYSHQGLGRIHVCLQGTTKLAVLLSNVLVLGLHWIIQGGCLWLRDLGDRPLLSRWFPRQVHSMVVSSSPQLLQQSGGHWPLIVQCLGQLVSVQDCSRPS